MTAMQQIIETKIQELEEKKVKAPFWKRWWVQKIIDLLKEILIEWLSKKEIISGSK